MQALPSRWKHLVVNAVSVVVVMILISPVHAGAPQVRTQAPGYYRMMLGHFEVTALSDGNVDLNTKLLANASEGEVNNLLSGAFIDSRKMQTSVNAFLINTGASLILVDAGTNSGYNPAVGHLVENLKAAGYEPSQVDTILITHLHPDHFGGLVDAGGKPVFTKATIYVAKNESDFFLSEETASKAPADKQRYFKMARDIAAPYLKHGTWKTFEGDKLSVPGVTAVPTPGHTPGHTAYEVKSNGQSLLIWGDLVHVAAVQFAKPEVTMAFDFDQQQAGESRKAVFKRVAAAGTLAAGTHIPFPGIGRVRADGENAYTWVPVMFSPL